jgi:hypothetical protein
MLATVSITGNSDCIDMVCSNSMVKASDAAALCGD